MRGYTSHELLLLRHVSSHYTALAKSLVDQRRTEPACMPYAHINLLYMPYMHIHHALFVSGMQHRAVATSFSESFTVLESLFRQACQSFAPGAFAIIRPQLGDVSHCWVG